MDVGGGEEFATEGWEERLKLHNECELGDSFSKPPVPAALSSHVPSCESTLQGKGD